MCYWLAHNLFNDDDATTCRAGSMRVSAGSILDRFTDWDSHVTSIVLPLGQPARFDISFISIQM
jgi:hypothetical protein